MKVLGIDTSTKSLSIAILDKGKVLAEFNGEGRLRHSQDLIPKISSLLDSANLKLEDLDGFAVSIGPGSFTGLRIGVATIKGLNLAAPRPVAAVPTLDVLAANVKDEARNICVIVDAKKSKIYSCLYTKKNGKIKKETEYLLTTVEELLEKINFPIIFSGDGITLYKDKILDKITSAEFTKKSDWQPKANVVAALGAEKLKKNDSVSSDELVPMYLYSKKCSIRGVDR